MNDCEGSVGENQLRLKWSKNVKMGLISDGNRPFLVRKTLKRL